MPDLTSLPNIGNKLASKLEAAGITNSEELQRLGSVEAVLRVTGRQPLNGYNMLYAVEGAIRGVRWQSISREELYLLRHAYDRATDHD